MTCKSPGAQLSEASWMSFPSYFFIKEELIVHVQSTLMTTSSAINEVVKSCV